MSTEPVWDNIVTGWNGDETVHFGARQETGSALYQVDTMATISARGEVSFINVINTGL